MHRHLYTQNGRYPIAVLAGVRREEDCKRLENVHKNVRKTEM